MPKSVVQVEFLAFSTGRRKEKVSAKRVAWQVAWTARCLAHGLSQAAGVTSESYLSMYGIMRDILEVCPLSSVVLVVEWRFESLKWSDGISTSRSGRDDGYAPVLRPHTTLLTPHRRRLARAWLQHGW